MAQTVQQLLDKKASFRAFVRDLFPNRFISKSILEDLEYWGDFYDSDRIYKHNTGLFFYEPNLLQVWKNFEAIYSELKKDSPDKILLIEKKHFLAYILEKRKVRAVMEMENPDL